MTTFLIILIIALIAIWIAQNKIDQKKAEFEMQQQELLEEEANKESAWHRIHRMEVYHQATLVGDDATVKAALNEDYDGKLPEEDNGVYTSLYDNLLILPIAGMRYRGNLHAYEGNFNGVLIPEPKNEYDPNAIMVKCEDGKHLGYVPEADTERVREFIGYDFNRYRITGIVNDLSVDGFTYYTGCIYIVAPRKI